MKNKYVRMIEELPISNVSILGVYILFLAIADYFAGSKSPVRALSICSTYLVVFVVLVILVALLRGVNIIGTKKNWMSLNVVMIICTLGCMGIMLIWFAALYPGCFNYDCMFQLDQAVHGNYNDWHPVWHTLCFYTLPLHITSRFRFIVLFQMIYFSLSIGYMCRTIYKYAGILPTVLSFACILLNPTTGRIMAFPLKDVGFGIACLMVAVMVVEIFLSDKHWIGHPLWLVVFVFSLTNATLFRHNGVLFTVPVVVFLLFVMDIKKWLIIAFCFIIAVAGIKLSVNAFLDIEKIGGRVVETMGLPLSVITTVAKENPETLDDELSGFVYRLTTREALEEHCQIGDFNSIKQHNTNWDVIEKTGTLSILKMMLKCFRYAPRAAFKGLFALTDLVYGLNNGTDGELLLFIYPNGYGIKYDGNEAVLNKLVDYSFLFTFPPLVFLRTHGVWLLGMLVVILAKLKVNSWQSWKKIFQCLPIFVYDFGTMLLLSGKDARFFYLTFLISPVVIVFLLCERPEIDIGNNDLSENMSAVTYKMGDAGR